MKLIYGYALFFGLGWGLAIATHRSFTEIACMGFVLLGWAVVCRLDK